MSAVIYSFVPCCDPNADPIQFNTHGVFLPTVPGTYLYTDLPLNGLENGQCYTVTETTGGLPNPALPYLNSIAGFQLIAGGCEDEECSCGDQCFVLTSCDGFVIYSDSNLILYNNQYVSLVEYPGECFLVQLYTQGGCGQSPQKVNVDGDIPCTCPCTCYIITGTGTVSYINCDGQNATAFAPAQFCSATYPEITAGIGTIQIFDNGLCDEVTGCPEKCFLLTNCDVSIPETIISNTFTLLGAALNSQVVTLVGYEGCWLVTETEDCDCAVAVTVIQSFSTCETCSPPPAYKLTNCKNSAQIIYTYEDLSLYIGRVVELDCGGCWIVELLDITPPSTQVIAVLADFDTCVDCQATYYELSDCTGVLDPIYTSQDLSAYLNQVVQLKHCPDTCWTVDIAKTPINPGNIYVEQSFLDCPTCYAAVLPCVCQTITNNSPTKPLQATYVDCNGVQQLITIPVGQTSEKLCLVYIPKYEESEITVYGNCIDGNCPPPPPLGPKRKIKPGYSVPVCDPEKYEKITCKASEIYYKMVLQKRYGISNCCDELENKWLLKKEIIDLQGLRDPDYTCTAITSCCNQQVPTCGGGCNCRPLVSTCNS